MQQCPSRSVALERLSRFYWHTTDDPSTHGLVIGYAKPPEHAFTVALDTLTGMLAELYPQLGDVSAGPATGERGGRRAHGGGRTARIARW
jgi:hypothetical protein